MSTDVNPDRQLPVKIETTDLQFVPLMDLGMDKQKKNMISSNFSGQGVQAAAFITQALAKEGVALDEMGDKVFPTKYYLAHVAEFVDEGGEVWPMPRVVLIGPAGETLAFVSEGAIRSLDLIRSLCGDGPWDPPLPISVVQIKTRRSFRTYRLVLGSQPDGDSQGTVHRKRGEPKA